MKLSRMSAILTITIAIVGSLPLEAAAPCCAAGVIQQVNEKTGAVVVRLATGERVEVVLDRAEPVGIRAGAKVKLDFARESAPENRTTTLPWCRAEGG
ncbi:MAG: hypothetical protein LC732_12375 [Acidobacteria bacterium]|nr:hypothetical protein [Acidobacteriota bacterium]